MNGRRSLRRQSVASRRILNRWPIAHTAGTLPYDAQCPTCRYPAHADDTSCPDCGYEGPMVLTPRPRDP
jgi:hypothetical protein